MTSDRTFFGVCALLFVGSATLTGVWCESMSGMPGMPGMSMSMWMRMPGQTWPGAVASFVCMWAVMMVAMMLPSLLPMLWRYRRTFVGTCSRDIDAARTEWLTAVAGGGYFFVWTMLGVAIFPLGVALAAVEMHPSLARAVPILGGLVVLMTGFLQITPWKAKQLSCCRESPRPGAARVLPGDVGTAWRHGLNLGLQCSRCCGGLMLIPLVIGVMDLRAMAVVTLAVTAERLAPAGERVARAVGAVVVGAGLLLIVRAVGAG